MPTSLRIFIILFIAFVVFDIIAQVEPDTSDQFYNTRYDRCLASFEGSDQVVQCERLN